MKKAIIAISEQGQIQKDYCRNANNRIRNTFKWKIDVTDTKFYSNSGKGTYILQIRTLENCGNYTYSICDIQSTNDSKIKINPDNTIDIKGDASVDFKVVCEIDANKINNQETKYDIILKKVGTSENDTTSDVFSFTLTAQKELCRICQSPHNLGICRIEPKAVEFIGTTAATDVEVADIVISSLPDATANDIISIQYNQPNHDVEVKYGNVSCDCYLFLGSTNGETDIPIPTTGEIRIPIRVQQLPTPNANTQELTISADIQYTSCRHKEEYHTITATVPYRISTKVNALKLTIDDPATTGMKDVTNINEDKKKVTITPPATYTIDLNIENEALQAVGANCGIHVRNIKRTILNVQDLTGRFENAAFDPANEWNISSNNTYIVHSVNKGIATLDKNSEALPNTQNVNHIVIPLLIDSEAIKNIVIKDHNRTADIKIKVEFDYKVDQLTIDNVNNSIIAAENNNDGYIHHEFHFTLMLERSHITEWHALDFGTSAVVNIKSENSWRTQSTTNLKSKKGKLLAEIYPKQEEQAKRNDTGEEDAPNLIASTLYINPAADTTAQAEGAQQYINSRLWFSPSTGMVNPGNRLPCVKNMIGNRELPYIPGVDCNELNVKQVVSTAYEQLCKYYLNDENIEGLILTVPNSFTPLHINSIREIVMNQISSLSKDTLDFVSESDAVLWSYIEKTRQTLPAFKQDLTSLNQQNKEYILIFDMGAGTLDITYAECTDEIDENGQLKCSIDIKSRIGVSKAGNYIDYLIGEIILKIMGNKGITPAQWNRYARTLAISGGQADHKDKKDLREYLRNKVKVMLGNPEMTLPPVAPNANDGERYKLFNDCDSYEILGKIKVGEILEDQLFKDFIESCTRKLMQELALKQGSTDFDPNRQVPKFLLDTVILSGRTTSLPAISQSLKESFNEYSTPNYNFHLKNTISSLQEINAINDILYLESATNDRKTVVARGALDYVQLINHCDGYEITSKKRIYGCYGLLYKWGNQVVGWQPLVSEENYMQDGIHDVETNTYSNEINVNTAGKTRILLCHTYNSNPKEAATSGNYDSITILHEYPVVGVSNNRIRIEINDEREINYKFNGLALDLQPHDDYTNEALRKSLWPVVCL